MYSVAIVDPMLGIEGGHYYPYAKSLTQAAQSLNLKVCWYTNRSFRSEFEPSGIQRFPLFDRTVFEELESSGENWVLNNFNFLNQVFNTLNSIPLTFDSTTLFIFPNLLHTQLYAVIEWSKLLPRNSRAIAILRWNNALMHYNIARGVSSQIADLYRFCFSRLGELNDKLTIASDTSRMCGFYSGLGKVKVLLLPNPQVSQSRLLTRLSKNTDGESRAIVLSHLGGFAPLRGSSLLPDIFDRVLLTFPDLVVRCHVNNFDDLDFLALRSVQIKRKSRVVVLGDVLDESLYNALFLTTDLLLMAYHPDFYKFGSSGVACEALTFGVPSIIPADTTIEDDFSAFGAGFTASRAFSVDAYEYEIGKAIRMLPTLTQRSEVARQKYRDAVSPVSFLESIFSHLSIDP